MPDDTNAQGQPVPYLGDGVYATWDGENRILTTGTHEFTQADNKVFLSTSELKAMQGFLARVRHA